MYKHIFFAVFIFISVLGEGSAIRCFEGLVSKFNNVVKVSRKECPPGNKYCITSSITVNHFGLLVPVNTYHCVPALTLGSCSSQVLCPLIKSSLPLPAGATISKCETECCATDYCNYNPATVTPPSPGESRICYKGLQIGKDKPYNRTAVVCTASNVCTSMAVKFRRIGITTFVTSHDCSPFNSIASCNELCNITTNGFVPHVKGTTIEDCQVKCCSENLCNNSPYGATVTPSMPKQQTKSTVKGKTFKCYHGVDNTNKNIKIVDCPLDGKHVCSVVSAELSGFRKTITYGAYACTAAPESVCKSEICRLTKEQLPIHFPGLTVKSCKTICCTSDYCNTRVAISTATPTIVVPYTKAPPNDKSELRCYQGFGKTVSIKTCSKSEYDTCTSGTLQTTPDSSQTTVWQCDLLTSCTNFCRSMKMLYPDLHDCKVKCCSKNGCNEGSATDNSEKLLQSWSMFTVLCIGMLWQIVIG